MFSTYIYLYASKIGFIMTLNYLFLRSGSMHGQSFEILKLSAKTLINTLGENDYVNVASFSNEVKWVTDCMDTLVQGNIL